MENHQLLLIRIENLPQQASKAPLQQWSGKEQLPVESGTADLKKLLSIDLSSHIFLSEISDDQF